MDLLTSSENSAKSDVANQIRFLNNLQRVVSFLAQSALLFCLISVYTQATYTIPGFSIEGYEFFSTFDISFVTNSAGSGDDDVIKKLPSSAASIISASTGAIPMAYQVNWLLLLLKIKNIDIS